MHSREAQTQTVAKRRGVAAILLYVQLFNVRYRVSNEKKMLLTFWFFKLGFGSGFGFTFHGVIKRQKMFFLGCLGDGTTAPSILVRALGPIQWYHQAVFILYDFFFNIIKWYVLSLSYKLKSKKVMSF